MGFIDAHVHVWSDDRKAYPRATEAASNPERFTAEDLFAHSRPAGVTRIVLIQPGQYRYDNRYMLETIARHKGVFSGVAVMDPHRQDPEPAMRALRRQGVMGFRITPGGDPQGWLEQPAMDRMWRAAAGTGQAMCPLVNPNAIPSIDRACARHPRTRVVIDHIARIGADGTIRDADVQALCGLARHPNLYVKLSAFYALGQKKPPYTDLLPMIGRVFETFGPRRLMWASDGPYQTLPPHSYAESVALLKDRMPRLSKDDKAWLLEKTAESVFFS